MSPDFQAAPVRSCKGQTPPSLYLLMRRPPEYTRHVPASGAPLAPLQTPTCDGSLIPVACCPVQCSPSVEFVESVLFNSSNVWTKGARAPRFHQDCSGRRGFTDHFRGLRHGCRFCRPRMAKLWLVVGTKLNEKYTVLKTRPI